MAGETTYIILFRGVGGATQLPTAPLRAALTEAGFKNAATYINSGNALVRTRLSREKVISTIAKICAKEFKFDKEIYAISREEWAELIEKKPFGKNVGGRFLHAAWLAAKPDKAKLAALREHAQGDEAIEVVGNVAYIHTPNGFGPSKFAARFDKGIGVPNTARNWNTVLKLMELADKAAK
jgi:uncharacterized protein (DUF1697 family)